MATGLLGNSRFSLPFSCAVQQRQQSTNQKLRRNVRVHEKFRTHPESSECWFHMWKYTQCTDGMHQRHKNIHQPFQFNEVVCIAVNIQLLLQMFFYHLSYNQIIFFIFMSLLFQCSKFNVNVSCILNQNERTWLKFN